MTGIHQFVPTFEPGAVGAHMLQVRRVVREMGFDSEIFAEHRRWPGVTDVEEYRRYGRAFAAGAGDVLLYQTAIGSVVADFVLDRPETLAVNYHNITPVGFFAQWEPDVVHGVAWGRAQLAAMGERAVLGIADSGYNEQELIALHYRRTTVAGALLSSRRPPPPKVSGTAVEAYATTGRRWCMASSRGTQKPSWSLTQTKTSAAR